MGNLAPQTSSAPAPAQPPVVSAPRNLADILARRRGTQPAPAPAQPTGALNESQQALANAILGEAKNTLLKLGNTEARANTLVGAFLPDVMRIDTTQPSNYNVDIPASCLNAKGSPICGRKLTDDVIDLTLKVLTNNPAATDNVSYEGNSNNPAQGHKPLETSFPYLALPN